MTPLSIGLIILGVAVIVVAIKYGSDYLWRKLRENENLKYEFITIIAHKFRTPLTHMKWLSEGLIADELDPRKRENLREMRQANQKLIDLTGTLIELTDSDDDSKSSYVFETVNLRD